MDMVVATILEDQRGCCTSLFLIDRARGDQVQPPAARGGVWEGMVQGYMAVAAVAMEEEEPTLKDRVDTNMIERSSGLFFS